MKRIDTTHAVTDKNGTGQDGFDDGEAGVSAPTEVDSTWLNHVQEEIARSVELGGLTLDSADKGQLSRLVIPLGASANFSGATIAPNAAFTFASIHADTGFTIGATSITLPSFGLYLVNVSALIKTDYTSDIVIGVTLIMNGVEQFVVLARRGSASATDKVGVSGGFAVHFPSGTKTLAVQFNNDARGGGGSGDRATIASGEGWLSVVRLRSYE